MKVYYSPKHDQLVLVTYYKQSGVYIHNSGGSPRFYVDKKLLKGLVLIGDFYSGEIWSME